MKNIKPLLPSIMILFLVLSFYSLVAINPLFALKRRDSNYYVIKNAFVGCQSLEKTLGSRQAVFRIDDPHAFFMDDIVFRMVDDAVANNVRVVLGVIPKDLERDNQLVSFLKHNKCNVEIALHGWDHSQDPPEFAYLTEEEAYERMVRGKTLLESLFNVSVDTFIAPQNQYSEGTIKAALRAGFRVFSSERVGEYGYNAATYDFGAERFLPSHEVVYQCMSNFNNNEPCIIMMHPQDYSSKGKLDKEKYGEYLNLIERLKKLDTEMVTFKDLSSTNYEGLKEVQVDPQLNEQMIL